MRAANDIGRGERFDSAVRVLDSQHLLFEPGAKLFHRSRLAKTQPENDKSDSNDVREDEDEANNFQSHQILLSTLRLSHERVGETMRRRYRRHLRIGLYGEYVHARVVNASRAGKRDNKNGLYGRHDSPLDIRRSEDCGRSGTAQWSRG
jgi:hypothetical protein